MAGGPDLVAVLLRDGTALNLRADVNAICDFEGALVREGFDAWRELSRIEAGLGATVSAYRALIWACAKDRHEGITLRHVGDLLQADGPPLRAGVLEALRLAAPDREDDGGDPPGKPTPPAG